VLTLLAVQPEALWDEALPVEVKELPEDLAGLDRLLGDPGLLAPIYDRFRREVIEDKRAVLTDGRPTIAIETYIRLMVLKQRYRRGIGRWWRRCRTRFICGACVGFPLERVPDESTVRKLTRRIGADTVNELTRALIVEATRSKRFRARAVRIDSTVIEADVRYPTDAGLAGHGVRAVTRTIRRRSGQAKSEVLKLTAGTGKLLEKSIAETRRLAVIARRRARGRGAKHKLCAAAQLEELADRCEKVANQIKQRVAGEPIKDRLVSLADPDARPIRKGSLGNRTSSGMSTSSAR
jgi:IS5 family transposase